MQAQIQFPVHAIEKTREGEKYLNASRTKLEGNIKRLLQYWQKNNLFLSNKNASLWLDINNLVQRIPDIKKFAEIEDREVKGEHSKYKEYRLKCTCRIVGGNDVTDNCYLHSEKLRVG